ncbi:MAG: class D sortase [Actinobacteria bacterium]|nr:MAG: class D sortase [Actinomycetota bacterium]
MAGDRLIIPRLKMNVGVSGGSRDKALRTGAWWHAGTAQPAEGGNTVLAGHRVRRVFARLSKVRPGDEIHLKWDDNVYRYRVTKVYTVDPSEVGILRQTGAEKLTLYTCIPRAFGNKRTVVVAEPAE